MNIPLRLKNKVLLQMKTGPSEVRFSLSGANYLTSDSFDKYPAYTPHTSLKCPHRGATLQKCESGYICPFHGWKFDQDGRLLESTGPKCPYPAGSLRIQEMETFVLGKMRFQGIRPKGDFLDEIDILSHEGSYVDQRIQVVHCHWKFLVDSLLETYHFPFAHGSLFGEFDHAFYSLKDQDGFNSRIVVPLGDIHEAQNDPTLQGINVMYFLFPFSFVLFMKSGFVWFTIKQLGVSQTELTSTLYSYGDEFLAKGSFQFLDQVLHQDFEILEAQQINLKREDRYFLTGHEILIRNFHKNCVSA